MNHIEMIAYITKFDFIVFISRPTITATITVKVALNVVLVCCYGYCQLVMNMCNNDVETSADRESSLYI